MATKLRCLIGISGLLRLDLFSGLRGAQGGRHGLLRWELINIARCEMHGCKKDISEPGRCEMKCEDTRMGFSITAHG